MRGIKNLKEIEIELKIIKNIKEHELIKALEAQLSCNDQSFSLFLYQTLNDVWLNLERASKLKTYIQQYCDQVLPVGINDNNLSTGENSYLFKIKYEGKTYILKAIQKSQSDANDSQEIQFNLLKKQINKNSDLNSQVLKIFDDHPLYKCLIKNSEYSFLIFEYFICTFSDLLIYQNDTQKMFKQENQRRIPLIIIARIMVEIFKIITEIKNQRIKIKNFNLNNIYLTQHITKAQKSVIEIKIGNLTCINQTFDHNKQVEIILFAINHSLSAEQQQELMNYHLLQKDQKNKNLYSFDSNISEQENNQLGDDYKLIVSQSKLVPAKIHVLENGIIHLIDASYFQYEEQSVNQSQSNQDSYQESNFEEQKDDSNSFYQVNLSNSNQGQSKGDTNYVTDSSTANQFRITKVENFSFSKILRQISIEVNKISFNASNISSSLQEAYELSEEFKEIKTIIEQNNCINVKFVKLGQNSKHFICQSCFQDADYYVKVYNKNTQHILTDNFINNQINAYNKINWDNESYSLISQIEETDIQIRHLSDNQNQSTVISEAQKYLLKTKNQISKGNFTLFFYEKCLCNLRDILPYLQSEQLIFPNIQNSKYSINDLLKQISMKIVYIFKCIHDSQFVHMDFDLTKFLIDKQGNIRISNFQLCQEPKQIKIALAKCYNQVYQKILQKLFDINESFVNKQINEGKYNSKIIQADYLMLGFTLIELFLCLDYRKFSEKIWNIQLTELERSIVDSSQILKIKLLNPKIQYIFDEDFQISEADQQNQQPVFEISQQQKQLIKIALDLMSRDVNNNKLSNALKQLQNI
ncbi:hypothetical protein ABPG74_004170 [Tetrahymena malaccensis]